MLRNPYRDTGALDPVKEKLVLVPRTNELNRVIQGIKEGAYWAILGIRQIGKTTFLRQIENEFPNAYFIYFNFEIPPEKEENFYQWLIDKFIEEIPSRQGVDIIKQWEKYAPEFKFVNFLENFKPKNDKKKIILLFDEIEGIPFLAKFLYVWRKVFQDRYHRKALKKYSVVIAGAKNLVTSTVGGPNAPFDIAETYYIQDFTEDEARRLIDRPFKQLNIKIDQKAKEKLISQISGHPQLLQYACKKLADTAISNNREISVKNVDETMDLLLIENHSIDTLREDVKDDQILEKLIGDIFKGKKRKYHPYKEYSINGAGCIVEDDNSFCVIRNKVYERFLKDYLDIKAQRYDIIEQIGKGGMGVVYRAKDLELDRTVAIKKITGEFTQVQDTEFIEEARTNAKLTHQNIVRVYDIAQIGNDHVIIMEFIDGSDYKKIVETSGPLTVQEILLVGKYLFAALAFSHKKEIIHRDIKPQNIMKSRDSEIKILDFGIAIIGESDTKRALGGYIVGSPHYLSPEQIRKGKVDHRTDIYSAGVTLFHLATGEVPFDGETMEEIFNKHLFEPVPPIRKLRREIPFELVEIIERCMEKEREDRFPNAERVLEQLKTLERNSRKSDSQKDGIIMTNENDSTIKIRYETVRVAENKRENERKTVKSDRRKTKKEEKKQKKITKIEELI